MKGSDESYNEEVYQCRECDSQYKFNGERVRCYGSVENPHQNQPVDVVYPCGVCGDPITAMEICRACADESDVDAFTHPNEVWKKAKSQSQSK